MQSATTLSRPPEIIATTNEVKTSSIKTWGGGHQNIKYDTWKPRYTDEYIGEMLRDNLVQTAMIDELDDFDQHVWEIDTLDHGRQFHGEIEVGHGEQGRLQRTRCSRKAGRL